MKVYPSYPPIAGGLYGSWPRIWSSHIRITPIRNTFAFRCVGLYPEGYGKDTSPFSGDSFALDFRAEFDVKDGEVKGMAVFDSEPLSIHFPPRPLPPGDLKDIADVYFVREG